MHSIVCSMINYYSFQIIILLLLFVESRESAERKTNLSNYEKLLNVIIEAKKMRGVINSQKISFLFYFKICYFKFQIEFKYEEVQKGPKFTNLKEIKLFQFSK